MAGYPGAEEAKKMLWRWLTAGGTADPATTRPALSNAGVSTTEIDWRLPDGAAAQNFDGRRAGLVNVSVLATQRLTLVQIGIRAGQRIGGLTWLSGTTAANTPTNQWSVLYGPVGSLAKLAISPDDTTTAWAANTEKTFTFVTPYTILTTGYYYAALMVKATTPPSLQGVAPGSQALSTTPYASAAGTLTNLTDPASAPDPPTLNGGVNVPWVRATTAA